MRKKICNGYESVNVILDDVKLNVGKLFWDAAKMTWIKLQDKEYDPEDEEIIELCTDVVNNLALPTPKESVDFKWRIENISRVALAQITRGRIGWWYNVESQMPQKLSHGVTIPKNIYLDEELSEEAFRITSKLQDFYDKCYNKGIPPQDCRYMTMHGQQTSLYTVCNYNSLKGFFMMRAENGLTDELNYVARLMKKCIVDKVEDAKEKNIIDSLDYNLWQIMISKLDCLGANQKKCLIVDKVFGNTGRFESGNDRVPSPSGKVKPDYDFTKSAWYIELQELSEDLLFDGEKEMVKRWKNGGSLLGDDE